MRVGAREWISKERAHPENIEEYKEILDLLYQAVNESATLSDDQIRVVDYALGDLPNTDTRSETWKGSVPAALVINLATYINSCH